MLVISIVSLCLFSVRCLVTLIWNVKLEIIPETWLTVLIRYADSQFDIVDSMQGRRKQNITGAARYIILVRHSSHTIIIISGFHDYWCGEGRTGS